MEASQVMQEQYWERTHGAVRTALEGCVLVKAGSARLTALDPVGREIGEIRGTRTDGGVLFDMTGGLPAVNYHLTAG